MRFFGTRIKLFRMAYMKYFFWNLLPCALLFLGGCSGAKDKVSAAEAEDRGDVRYKKAAEAERFGHFDEALKAYQDLLNEKPNAALAHFQMALLFHDQKQDYIEAVHHYQRYLTLQGSAADKSELAQDRIRVAKQLLVAQMLSQTGGTGTLSGVGPQKEIARLNSDLSKTQGELASLNKELLALRRKGEDLAAENGKLRKLFDEVRPDLNTVSSSRRLVVKPEPEADEKAIRRSSALSDAKRIIAESEKPAEPSARAEIVPLLPVPDVMPPSVKTNEPKKENSLLGKKETVLSGIIAPDQKAREKQPGVLQKTYTVQPGDTLFRIAERHYGDPAAWRKIRDANRTVIDPDGRLRTGQILRLP